ncbi:hypothetical protein Daus18300_008900 [Diaporthe australafricana]|uniref:Uncharacterized protein n=1 Tax=Diaporthe australafricana TaxID=127596 RepID=A0ABR3WG78_9PEZI
MAPKQKTFELIPDLPGIGQGQHHRPAAAAAVQSKPPMTTKQAKKLYQQKSKGPKLSKAEQRRIDLMEQDRIRKEFEKEKAQARARTARDKKKAKEDKERDERRKRGLPLTEVHPSQDTISRFIRKLGFGANPQVPASNNKDAHLETVQEADSESATEAESDADAYNKPNQERKRYHGQDQDDPVPGKENEEPTDSLGDSAANPAKRRKFGHTNKNQNLLNRMIHIPSQRSIGAVARLAQEINTESWSRPSSIDADDPVTEVMLEDQLIADVELASSKSATKSSPNRQSPAREPLRTRVQPPSPASVAPRVPSPSPPPQPTRPQYRPQPPRFRPPAAAVTPQFARPRFISKQIKTAPKPVQASPTYAGSRRLAPTAANEFPMSTQLLVMNHIDELFPSPSQEARELYEDQQGANTAEAPTGPPSQAPAASPVQDQPAGDMPPELPFLATQDFILSSQDMEELSTPSKVRTGPASRAADCSQNGCAAPPASPPKKRMFGSSGPGAEVLVAMERSYKQNLAEERRRKEELRAQEAALAGAKTELVASQETDYGDFDFEAGELDMLADITWADDDLSDI